MFRFKTDIQRSHSKKKITKSCNSFGFQYGIFPLQSIFNYLSKILLNTQNIGSLECSVGRLLEIILELLVKTNWCFNACLSFLNLMSLLSFTTSCTTQNSFPFLVFIAFKYLSFLVILFFFDVSKPKSVCFIFLASSFISTPGCSCFSSASALARYLF